MGGQQDENKRSNNISNDKMPAYDPVLQLAQLIRKASRSHQKSFVDFLGVAIIKHEKLEKESTKENKDLQRIRESFVDFVDFFNNSIDKTFVRVCNFLTDYFMITGRSEDLFQPRVCIKGFEKNERDGVVLVSDLYRSRGLDITDGFPMDSNTGFKSICNDGRHFICNDIPSSAKAGLYQNSRLIPQNVQRYEINEVSSIQDPKWVECWKPYPDDDVVNPESVYKSTLIIPISIDTNNLSEEFRKKYKEPYLEKKNLLIYGFLCLDHLEINFFTKTDIEIGFMFANMLAIYRFKRFLCTKYSTCFQDIENFLDENEIYLK